MAAIPAGQVIRGADDLSAAWLGRVLGAPVARFSARADDGNWSRQLALRVELGDGTTRALRLKICLGTTFGDSELQYYRRDYAGLADAPLVRCFDACHEPGVGYHLLLEDLAATHHDRRDAPPTLEYGCAVARALGRMHAHHWQAGPAPDKAALDRYFDEIRPGVAAMQGATGLDLRARFDGHEAAMRRRWSDPRGLSLLHGDVNPTNVLTPRGAEQPVLLLDRQPFEWSLTYGLAAWDLAYVMLPWWPPQARRACETTVLRHWYEALGQSGYTWDEAQSDWRLSVEQALHVPLEWCSKPDTLAGMRWLWEAQLARIVAALEPA